MGSPIAGDLVILPQGPDRLAVGVELPGLRFKAPVGSLAIEIETDDCADH